MSILLITGPANAGKARALLDGFRAHVARGEDPILVVPTRADRSYYRRELAGSGVILGGRVERFAGLADELALRSGLDGGLPVSPLGREHLLRALACSPAFGPSASSPGFARALGRLAAELEARRVSPGRLRAAFSRLGPAGPAGGGELCELLEGYQRILERIGRQDGELRAVSALDALRREPSRWGWRPVLFYGFDDLTPLEFETIETLGSAIDAPVTVSLAYEPARLAFAGRARAFQRLAPIAREHRSLPASSAHYGLKAAPLHHLERSLFEASGGRMAGNGAVRLLEGDGERSELELVAGEVRALLDAEMPAAEIALVHRSPQAVAGLLGEVLRVFEIPYSFQYSEQFGHSAPGRALLGALRSALDGERAEPAELLAWLRSPGLLERPELADELEARVRRRGLRSANQARALWEAEHWPLDPIVGLAKAAGEGMLALIERALDELGRLFAAPRRRRASVLPGEELDEARALAAGRGALEELAELARAERGIVGDPSALLMTLERLDFLAGEPPGPGLVAVLDPLALRARRVRALFLCGLQEGVFPAPARPEALLGEEERGRLAKASGLLLGERGESLLDERYLLYATVSRPSELLVLSWHGARDDGSAASPSPFLEDVCELLEPEVLARRRRRALGAAAWPGPGPAHGRWQLADEVLAAPAASARTIPPLRDPRLLSELEEGRIWSASSLERWAACPAAWLIDRLLRPAEFEPKPEPLARGSLAHAALRDTLAGLRERTGSARLRPSVRELALVLLGAALERHEAESSLSASPERIPGARRRLRADLECYIERACAEPSPLEPAYLELGFGFSEQEEGSLPACEIGDGVRLRGRIDRVDLSESGEAVVYDYKSRTAPRPSDWLKDQNLQMALYMQVVEELLGLQVSGGFYQPLSARDLRSRGVLAREAGIELGCVRGDLREQDELEDLREQLLQAARQAASEARAGALAARPDSCSPGGGCRYPVICRCGR